MDSKTKDLRSNFALVLHAHLPYVIRHGNWPHGMDWLYEAASETYIPLLNIFRKLIAEGHSPQVTISITPVLAEQLKNISFKNGLETYLQNKISHAREDQAIFAKHSNEHLFSLAQYWEDFYARILLHFKEDYNRDLVDALAELQNQGHIEIITSAATHGYLPLLSKDGSVQAQVKQGVATYQEYFGSSPKGIWLPECAYRPGYNWKKPGAEEPAQPRKGIEEILSENKLRYFVVDSHLLKGGKPIGVYIDRFELLKLLWKQYETFHRSRHENQERSPYEIYLVGNTSNNSPVVVFTRDPDTGLQVWSSDCGYPGDGWYLDFHKKHFSGGNRYWRVTNHRCDLADKEEYIPEIATERVLENAGHFKQLVKDILSRHRQRTGHPGLICAPFDAELFGHWWFEGPSWLYHVLKSIDEDPELELVTCNRYLVNNPPVDMVSLPEGSWGQGGFHWIWLNEWTSWTWRHIYEAEDELVSLLKKIYNRNQNIDPDLQKIIKQLCREILLLQSSDWQFLISTWNARDYAEMRLTEHYQAFMHLAGMVRRYIQGEVIGEGEWNFLKDCQSKDKIFANINPKWFLEENT